MATPDEIKKYAEKIGMPVVTDQVVNPRIAELRQALEPKQELNSFEKTADVLSNFTGGKKLAQGIGKALAKSTVSDIAASQDMQAKDTMDALTSQLQAAFKDGRTADVKRLQDEIRTHIGGPAAGSDTLVDFQDTVPTNREIIGSAAQLAALAIPSGKLASGGGKLLTGAELAAKGAAPATSLLAKTAIGAGQGYVFDVAGKLQDKELDFEKVFTPGLGTAIGVAAPLIGAALSKLPKNQALAEREINSMIKPKQTDLAYGKNPAKAIIDEGLTASSLEELGTKVQDSINANVEAAKTLAEGTPGVIDATKALTPIDEAITKAASQNNQAAVNRLKAMKDALTNTLVLDAEGKIVSAGAKDLSKLSVAEAIDFKRDVGALTSFTGNPSDDKLVNKALKGVFGATKGAIDEVAPQLTDDIEHIASLIGAKNAIAHRIDIVARQNMVGFTDKLLTGGGLAGSLMTLSPVPFFVGLGSAAANRALSSPSFKTAFAQWLVSAPKSQIIQVLQAAPWTKALMVAATAPSSETPQ